MSEKSLETAKILAGYAEHSREIAALMGWFFLRHLGRLYHEFEGDFVLAIVLGEIAHHNICHFFSQGKRLSNRQDATNTATQIWNELAPCNAFSLSEATGIPRETVRRKIALLVNKGLVQKHVSGGYVILPEVSRSFRDGINLQTLLDFLTTSDELRRILVRE